MNKQTCQLALQNDGNLIVYNVLYIRDKFYIREDNTVKFN